MLETILLFADGFPDSSPNWVAAFVECFKCADSGPGFFAWNKCDTFPSFLHNSTVRFQIINCVSSTHATTNHVPLLFSTNILCFCPLCFRKTIFYALVICTLNTVTFPANEKYLPFWVPSEINRQRFSQRIIPATGQRLHPARSLFYDEMTSSSYVDMRSKWSQEER